MESKIYEPNKYFDFTKLILTTPILSGGSYYIKYAVEGNNGNNALYIQSPKCVTKQGIIKSGKKLYCDLIFSNLDETFIQWIESLESYSQKYIFDNRNKWFENELELEDIENSFSSSLKTHKSGKEFLLRTNVPCHLGKCILDVFNEDETEFNIEYFEETTNVITILEIQGIKCSPKNFQIDYEIKQMMVIKPNILFNKCIIQHSTSASSASSFKDNVLTSTSTTSNLAIPTATTAILTPEMSKYVKEKEVSLEQYTNIKENIQPQEIVAQDMEGLQKDVIKENNMNNHEDNDNKENNDIEENGDSEENDDNKENDDIEENDDSEEDEEDEKIKIGEIITEEKDKYQQHLGDYVQQLNNEVPDIEEVDFDLEKDEETDEPIHLKNKNDLYYEIYNEAFQKAKENRILAISNYFKTNEIENIELFIDFLEKEE